MLQQGRRKKPGLWLANKLRPSEVQPRVRPDKREAREILPSSSSFKIESRGAAEEKGKILDPPFNFANLISNIHIEPVASPNQYNFFATSSSQKYTTYDPNYYHFPPDTNFPATKVGSKRFRGRCYKRLREEPNRKPKESQLFSSAESSLFSLSLDNFCQGGYPSRQPYFEANQECQPACRVLNSQCGPDFKCHCRQGYHPTYLPAPILSSREPTLVFCQSLADLLLHNHSTANVSKGLDNMSPTDPNGTLIDVPKSYYPSKQSMINIVRAWISGEKVSKSELNTTILNFPELFQHWWPTIMPAGPLLLDCQC